MILSPKTGKHLFQSLIVFKYKICEIKTFFSKPIFLFPVKKNEAKLYAQYESSLSTITDWSFVFFYIIVDDEFLFNDWKYTDRPQKH